MNLDRRQFLGAAGGALLASLLPAPARSDARGRAAGPKVGMCDWNLGRSANPDDIPKAAAAGLDGVLVSVGTAPDDMPLRDPAVREKYLELGERYGISYPSVAAGQILNEIPLKSEPQSAVYVIDAVEAAKALGGHDILVAFFSDGDLRLKDAEGNLRNTSNGPYKEYALDERGVQRVVEALRQIAPRAEDAGIVLGLENTLTARQNLDILERVASPMVQVYYDVGNSTAYGYDVPTELRLLGNDRICEIHIKETLGMDDPQWGLLGGPTTGGVDWQGTGQAVHDIGYDKWFILETSGREGRFEEDTRANVAFVKQRFG
ncbi:MAG TPA: sugar phosphate isomerase/epimerase family protein [Rhodothermales bacterium]|nr:sugar phosphate isomerase/epimerase family protein [Rhodothermales bacterium]